VKDIEEQPNQFPTELDVLAALWVVMQKHARKDAVQLNGEDMRRGREAVREIRKMLEKQTDGGMFISTF
jgi:hypothetical protein